MDDIETVTVCPLGSKCKEVKDGKIYRCAWHTCVKGKDPQSEQIIDKWACAMSWMPLMMVENAQMVRGMTKATESFRNETVKGQREFNTILSNATSKRVEIDG